MALHARPITTTRKQNQPLSLYHLLEPEVLANPYPLYHRLRSEDPVHWDPFLHAWVVTRYADVIAVFVDVQYYRDRFSIAENQFGALLSWHCGLPPMEKS